MNQMRYRAAREFVTGSRHLIATMLRGGSRGAPLNPQWGLTC